MYILDKSEAKAELKSFVVSWSQDHRRWMLLQVKTWWCRRPLPLHHQPAQHPQCCRQHCYLPLNQCPHRVWPTTRGQTSVRWRRPRTSRRSTRWLASQFPQSGLTGDRSLPTPSRPTRLTKSSMGSIPRQQLYKVGKMEMTWWEL